MTMIAPDMAMSYALAIPLFGFFAIRLLRANENAREAATLIMGVALVALTLIVFAAVGADERPRLDLIEVSPGVSIALAAEPLGAVFALLAAFLFVINSLYSIGYMRGHHEKHQTRFYMAFAISIGAAMGVAYAANLYTMFVFYEALTLATYPLVAHKGDAAAKQGGRVYLGVLMATSIGLLLPAIVWTHSIAGGTDFAPGGLIAGKVSDAGAIPVVLMGLYAFGIAKAALMPVHPWLPNAMVAPTPVSAFLHAVAVVKAGVFAIMKVAIYVFGLDFIAASGAGEPYLIIAAVSVLLASAIAMRADNLKRRLAFSTVSQLSYVTIGAMLGVAMGAMGGAMQIVMHAFGKMTLFMCAGAIYVAAHKSQVSELRGLGPKMPLTFLAFFIGAMSIVGLPPLGGSWPKFLLMVGAADAGQLFVIAALALSSLLNVVYLLSIPVQAFYLAPAAAGARADGAGVRPIDWKRIEEAPLLCVLPPLITAAGALALFLFADPLYRYLAPILETP